jgi:hypothetical protein
VTTSLLDNVANYAKGALDVRVLSTAFGDGVWEAKSLFDAQLVVSDPDGIKRVLVC